MSQPFGTTDSPRIEAAGEYVARRTPVLFATLRYLLFAPPFYDTVSESSGHRLRIERV